MYFISATDQQYESVGQRPVCSELKGTSPLSGIHAFTVCDSLCIQYVNSKLNCTPSGTVIAFDAWKGEHQLVTSVQKAPD